MKCGAAMKSHDRTPMKASATSMESSSTSMESSSATSSVATTLGKGALW